MFTPSMQNRIHTTSSVVTRSSTDHPGPRLFIYFRLSGSGWPEKNYWNYFLDLPACDVELLEHCYNTIVCHLLVADFKIWNIYVFIWKIIENKFGCVGLSWLEDIYLGICWTHLFGDVLAHELFFFLWRLKNNGNPKNIPWWYATNLV